LQIISENQSNIVLNPIKQLAGQTAIYGLSSIIGRVIGYLLIPLYTRVFIASEYGISNELYAYSSLLLVLITYGMETAFFRFSETEKDRPRVYSTALISILASTAVFIIIVMALAKPVAGIIRYSNHIEYIIWIALIVSMDALTAIPFAHLRASNKAKRFATVKLINIFFYIALNLFFLLLCPYLLKKDLLTGFISQIYNKEIGVGYIFISNLIASALTIVLLLPEYLGIKYYFDRVLWKKMISYALPLLVVGFAGIINETMDRIFLKFLLPEKIAMSQVGIYGACYKISLILTIFIQAFRFAADPFFFAKAKEKNAKEIYADVMKYFIIICTFVFLIVVLYIDVIKYFVGKEYYTTTTHIEGGVISKWLFGSEISGLQIVPVLLIANMCLGIYYNLSIWYKLTDKTGFGAYISIIGAIITTILNIWWIPLIGYMGSAWATLICYASMMFISYFYGQKHYYIQYNLKRLLGYIGLSIALFFISKYIRFEMKVIQYVFNTLLLLIFIAVVYSLEKSNFIKKPVS
jgi:O-antigen/teichoic acid export membrane protein